MAATEQYLKNNEEYAKSFTHGPLPLPPARHTAVVACMDARLDPQAVLGLKEGDSHVIRNAGGVVTDDVLRSLVISQRLLGTKEIILIHHTDCGMFDLLSSPISSPLSSPPLSSLSLLSLSSLSSPLPPLLSSSPLSSPSLPSPFSFSFLSTPSLSLSPFSTSLSSHFFPYLSLVLTK
jgi:carbonic anhydrase